MAETRVSGRVTYMPGRELEDRPPGRPRNPSERRAGLTEDQREAVLQSLAQHCARRRSRAIKGRAASGIEQEWLQDEEFYVGIDDANRHEGSNAWSEKPLGQPEVTRQAGEAGVGSTIFLNITRPFVDAASARVADMLLPTSDRGWDLKPTPIPDLEVIVKEGKLPARLHRQVMQAFPHDPAGAQAAESEAIEGEKKRWEAAIEASDLAQRQIDDWLVECQYNGLNRALMDDAARIGTGVLKGPIPVWRVDVAYRNGALQIEQRQKPASTRVDVWNCYPDPDCGESIHNGADHWERDEITPRALADLRGLPGYFDHAIERVLQMGPYKAVGEWRQDGGETNGLRKCTDAESELYEIWYGYLSVSTTQLEALGLLDPVDGQEPSVPNTEYVSICVTMVNGEIIKGSVNLLDTGEFPYDYMVWQRRRSSPFGIGLARQLRAPQRIINAAMRNMMDNAGVAGGPMWIWNRRYVRPLNNIPQLAARKGWEVTAEGMDVDPSRWFQFIKVDMAQAELERIVMLGMRMAEDVSGMPLILQGQQGNAPDTVGGMQILNNNASGVVRRVARLYDTLITEPHIRRYYRYLMQYGEDDAAKGDFQVDARGSAALVERELNNQALMQIAQLFQDPIYGIDPRKLAREILRSMRLDVRSLEYDDDEWQEIVEQYRQIAAQGQQPPPDSRVEVAQIKADTDMRVAELRNEIDTRKLDFAEAVKALELEQQQRDQEMAEAVEAIAYEMENANLKARLFEVVEKLKLQREIAMSKPQPGGGGPQVATPATEPPGRAPNGQAFAR